MDIVQPIGGPRDHGCNGFGACVATHLRTCDNGHDPVHMLLDALQGSPKIICIPRILFYPASSASLWN